MTACSTPLSLRSRTTCSELTFSYGRSLNVQARGASCSPRSRKRVAILPPDLLQRVAAVLRTRTSMAEAGWLPPPRGREPLN